MSTLATDKRGKRRGAAPVRRGPRRLKPVEARPTVADYPYTMRLKDGRTIFVEVPGEWVTKDRSGEVAFLPAAVRLLDRVQALAMSTSDRPPTPGYLAALRVALGLTQAEFGERIGVDKLTVSRWERGTVRPSEESLAAVDKLRREAVRKGVVIPSDR